MSRSRNESQIHGHILSVIQWLLDKLGPLAEGYMGISPYTYWWDDDAPMIKKNPGLYCENLP